MTGRDQFVYMAAYGARIGVQVVASFVSVGNSARAHPAIGPLVRRTEVEIVDGVYRVRDDEPTPRIGAALHRTP